MCEKERERGGGREGERQREGGREGGVNVRNTVYTIILINKVRPAIKDNVVKNCSDN